jgi:hypothetical protein
MQGDTGDSDRREGGAGNLVICHVMMMHVHEDVLDDSGRIDPFKLDAVLVLV